jgi:predicted lipoprotein with Yx(FWY)xxD motif
VESQAASDAGGKAAGAAREVAKANNAAKAAAAAKAREAAAAKDAAAAPGGTRAAKVKAKKKAVTSPNRRVPRGVVVQLGRLGGHRALVDRAGRALYLFTPDGGNGASICTGQCSLAWPPLLGRAQAGAGVDKAHLRTIVRSDGKRQVTYHNWPLYYFIQDKRAGQTNGQGVGGVSYLVDGRGRAIK